MKIFFTELARMQNSKYIGFMPIDEYIKANNHRNNILTYDDVKKNIEDLFYLVEISGVKSSQDIKYYFERGIFETLI